MLDQVTRCRPRCLSGSPASPKFSCCSREESISAWQDGEDDGRLGAEVAKGGGEVGVPGAAPTRGWRRRRSRRASGRCARIERSRLAGDRARQKEQRMRTGYAGIERSRPAGDRARQKEQRMHVGYAGIEQSRPAGDRSSRLEL